MQKIISLLTALIALPFLFLGLLSMALSTTSFGGKSPTILQVSLAVVFGFSWVCFSASLLYAAVLHWKAMQNTKAPSVALFFFLFSFCLAVIGIAYEVL